MVAKLRQKILFCLLFNEHFAFRHHSHVNAIEVLAVLNESFLGHFDHLSAPLQQLGGGHRWFECRNVIHNKTNLRIRDPAQPSLLNHPPQLDLGEEPAPLTIVVGEERAPIHSRCCLSGELREQIGLEFIG